MAANHRVIEIGKSPDGTFHYHLKKGRNVLISAGEYNAKASIVKVVGHLFDLSDEEKKVLTYTNFLNLDSSVATEDAFNGLKKKAEPEVKELPPKTE